MRRVLIGGLSLALGVALVLAPFASRFPDGLERVAEDLGFSDRAEGKAVFPSPIPDYALPGVGGDALATVLSGLIGTLAAFGLAWIVGAALRTRKRPSSQSGD